MKLKSSLEAFMVVMSIAIYLITWAWFGNHVFNHTMDDLPEYLDRDVQAVSFTVVEGILIGSIWPVCLPVHLIADKVITDRDKTAEETIQ